MPRLVSSALSAALVDNLPCGVVLRAVGGTLVAANRRAYDLLGVRSWDELQRAAGDVTVPLLSGSHTTSLTDEACTPPSVASPPPWQDGDVRVTRPDGRPVWLHLQSVELVDLVDGHVIATTLIDVTERHIAEEALRDQTASAAEVLSLVNVRHRQQQAIAELGRSALEGTGAQELMDRACRLVATTLDADRVRVMELIPAQRNLLLRAGLGWRDGLVGTAIIPFGSQAGYLLESNEPLVIEDFRSDLRFQISWLLHEHPVVSGIRAVIRGRHHPFGELAAYTIEPRKFTDDDIYFMRAIANTLAEALMRIAAGAELENSVRQLRQTDAARHELLRRLSSAVEQERSRIARDVHDGALQALAALGLRLEVLREQLDRPGQKESVEQIVSSLKHSTKRLRQLILDLRPEPLEIGLRRAIQFYFEHSRGPADPTLVVRSTIRRDPPAEQRLAIYRACQEALNNVRKHAQARRIVVSLADERGGLGITIEDEGKGFVVSRVPRRGHLGLTAMRERAELLGGTFSIRSRRGRGTTVRFWFPLGEDPPHRTVK